MMSVSIGVSALAEWLAAGGLAQGLLLEARAQVLSREASDAAALLAAVGFGWGLARQRLAALSVVMPISLPFSAAAATATVPVPVPEIVPAFPGGGAAAIPSRSTALPPPLDCGLTRLHAEVAAIRAAERILLRVTPEEVLAARAPGADRHGQLGQAPCRRAQPSPGAALRARV